MDNPNLTDEEKSKLLHQESRGLVSDFHQQKLEREAKANWDKFYKRNEGRFFKDRNWTTREFEELADGNLTASLLEVGCGVGNFIFPLLSEGIVSRVYACDFSPRAVDLVKKNELYNPEAVTAFVCDLTKDELLPSMDGTKVDIASLVFVLSSILPGNFKTVLQNIHSVLKPGGCLLFRDYGTYDMAMIRFGPGCKLGDRFYVRQDGTRSYFFEIEELERLFVECGFEVLELRFVHRQTVNKKEGVDAKRTFIQARCRKPS